MRPGFPQQSRPIAPMAQGRPGIPMQRPGQPPPQQRPGPSLQQLHQQQHNMPQPGAQPRPGQGFVPGQPPQQQLQQQQQQGQQQQQQIKHNYFYVDAVNVIDPNFITTTIKADPTKQEPPTPKAETPVSRGAPPKQEQQGGNNAPPGGDKHKHANPYNIAIYDLDGRAFACPSCCTSYLVQPSLRLFYSTCCGRVLCQTCRNTAPLACTTPGCLGYFKATNTRETGTQKRKAAEWTEKPLDEWRYEKNIQNITTLDAVGRLTVEDFLGDQTRYDQYCHDLQSLLYDMLYAAEDQNPHIVQFKNQYKKQVEANEKRLGKNVGQLNLNFASFTARPEVYQVKPNLGYDQPNIPPEDNPLLQQEQQTQQQQAQQQAQQQPQQQQQLQQQLQPHQRQQPHIRDDDYRYNNVYRPRIMQSAAFQVPDPIYRKMPIELAREAVLAEQKRLHDKDMKQKEKQLKQLASSGIPPPPMPPMILNKTVSNEVLHHVHDFLVDRDAFISGRKDYRYVEEMPYNAITQKLMDDDYY